MRRLEPVTPGELLLEEFLKPMGISQYRLAKEIGVPAQRIGEIVAGRRAITADSDLRLCRFFGLSNGYWLRAQAAHDTEVAERTLRAKLATIRPWTQKAGEKPRATSRSSPAACALPCGSTFSLGQCLEARHLEVSLSGSGEDPGWATTPGCSTVGFLSANDLDGNSRHATRLGARPKGRHAIGEESRDERTEDHPGGRRRHVVRADHGQRRRAHASPWPAAAWCSTTSTPRGSSAPTSSRPSSTRSPVRRSCLDYSTDPAEALDGADFVPQQRRVRSLPLLAPGLRDPQPLRRPPDQRRERRARARCSTRCAASRTRWASARTSRSTARTRSSST